MGTNFVILSIVLIALCLYLEFVSPRCAYCTRRYAMKKTGRRRNEGGRFLVLSDDEYRCKYCGHIEWL